jgi:cell division protein FtsB
MRVQSKKSDSNAGKRRMLRFRWEYLLLIAFMGFFGYKFMEKHREVQTLQQEAAAVRYQNQQVHADNMKTRREIRYYRTKQYVEDTARSNLGYTLPGETTVIAAPRHHHAPVVRAAPPRPAAPPKPTWQQWWNSFFG